MDIREEQDPYDYSEEVDQWLLATTNEATQQYQDSLKLVKYLQESLSE